MPKETQRQILERKYAAARKVKPQSRALERLASAMDVAIVLSFSTGVLFVILLFIYVLTHELKH